MILKLGILIVISLLLSASHAQEFMPASLTIGSPAPPLQLGEWIKGKPISAFEKGKIYVLEFWATWCGPCIVEMPSLSALARKYKDRVIILGVDIKEKKTTSLKKVKDFVDSMGRRMDISVAADDSGFMANTWYEALGDRRGMPKSFVVDGEGRVAWIGHPTELAGVLSKVVGNTWDLDKESAEQDLNMRLEHQDMAANYILNTYEGKSAENIFGEPDSALLVINELTKKEPKLKFTPFIAYHTFSALIKTNPEMAYTYAKETITTTTYTAPAYNSIINNIEINVGKFGSLKEIYRLGAEAYRAMIDHYPLTAKTSQNYIKMAEWYLLSGNKPMAKRAMRKSIKALKKVYI